MGLVEAGSTVCLASGSNAGTGNEEGMNLRGRLNDGRQKCVLKEASHSWCSLGIYLTEKTTIVGSGQLAGGGVCKNVHGGDTKMYSRMGGRRGKVVQ